MGISTLIKTLTASGSASLDFVDGTSSVVLDSTYDEYMFVFTDINPATDSANFTFQVNATDDAGGDYDTTQKIVRQYMQERINDMTRKGHYKSTDVGYRQL